MHIETEEINGFAIDEFNQYKLEEGKKQGVCPLCSSDRKAKNKKSNCSMYDWERGIGTCMNCNTSYQLHTYKRKNESEKVYIRPVTPPAIHPISTKVEEWFKTRGISGQTLKDLRIEEGPSICRKLVKPKM